MAGIGSAVEVAAGSLWYVAHTRSRCEKKLLQYCVREGHDVSLPCVESIKRYGRKTVAFRKPLFPGYVFFRSQPERVQTIYRNEYTVNVLTVYDQDTFERQLEDILQALESGCVVGTTELSAGKQVEITAGPLAGMSGIVLQASNPATVILRLDFIGQGAAVVVGSAFLEVTG